MDNRGKSGHKGGTNLYARGRIERGDDMATSQYTSREI